MSAADGLVRNEEVAGATPATLTILRKAGRYKLAAPVSKTGSAPPRSEHYRRLPPLSTLNERKSYETRSPLSKPIALPSQLQTGASNPNQTDAATEPRCSIAKPIRRKTTIDRCLVAQKQSTRLITGRPRSVTARDNQIIAVRKHPRVAEED